MADPTLDPTAGREAGIDLDVIAARANDVPGGEWECDGDADSWNGEDYARWWVNVPGSREWAPFRFTSDVPPTGGEMCVYRAVATFIAHAPEDVRAMAREIRDLRAEIARRTAERTQLADALREAQEDAGRYAWLALHPGRITYDPRLGFTVAHVDEMRARVSFSSKAFETLDEATDYARAGRAGDPPEVSAIDAARDGAGR